MGLAITMIFMMIDDDYDDDAYRKGTSHELDLQSCDNHDDDDDDDVGDIKILVRNRCF